jgi:zinc protease
VSILPRSYRPLVALVCLLSLGLFLAPVPGEAADKEKEKKDDVALKAASALYEGIQVHTLDNGLRVYLKPIPGAATVTTMVAYKVGSADEDLDHTGLSHYLEHLMFKGTDKIRPGDIDKMTLRNGGANNAYTDTDYTIYHFDFAADRWEAALEIEADRMQNLRIDKKHEFEQEKGAVISELKRNEDTPWDLEQKAIVPLLFGKDGPYGHPVIGETKHVRDATAVVIKAHYDKWYHPNNASLVIVGGFDPDKALANVKKLFGPIPKKELPSRKPLSKAELKRPARLDMPSKFEVPRLLMGFNAVASADPDYPALAALDAILSGGKTSRMYKALIEGAEIASAVNTSNTGGRYPGWFAVQVELLKGKDRAKAEELVLKEIKKVRDEPVSDAELKRAKQGVLAAAIFARESVHGLADSIAQGVTTNDLDYLKNYLPRLLKVTPADVQRVAKKYLDPEKRVTVWSIPGKGEGKGEKGPAARRAQRLAPRADGVAKALSLKDAKRVQLDNGLTLLLLENHRLPIVVASALVGHVGESEPEDKLGVATLTGSLLDEGTTKHKGEQIAELIEDVGGLLSMSATGGSVQVLAPDRSLGLGLLLECLSSANFPREAFARNQERQLSEIADEETRPNTRAAAAFRAAVYGKHYKGRPAKGTLKTVKALTPADCLAFYRKVFVPNNTTLAIVGDFDSKEVIAEVEKLTKDWKKAPLEPAKHPEVEKPKEFTQKVLTMPDASQLHFYMGHVGIRRNNPDYFKLLVMDYVLGTGPGFTDRLSSRLRDREGLAYTVQANITDSADIEPGTFRCYIGTMPEKFAVAKKEFLEEIRRIRDEKPTDEEVKDARNYLLGSLPLRLNTNGAVAAELLAVEKYGLGFDYLDKYRKEVAAVTAADVQQVAKKYLDPEHMYLVVAGAVDASGKVLKPRKP